MSDEQWEALGAIRKRGTDILTHLVGGDDQMRFAAKSEASQWAADLGTAVASWGARVQARFDTLGAFNDEEVHYAEHHVSRAVGAGLATLSTSCMTEGELDTAIRCLAVRLHRLEKLFAPDGTAPPSEPRKKRPVGRPGDKRATEQRDLGWADEMQRQPDRDKIDVAREIASRGELTPETIVREERRARAARRARELRGKKIPRTNISRR